MSKSDQHKTRTPDAGHPNPAHTKPVPLDLTHLDAILFDVDETLFDRRRAQGLVLEQMRQQLPDLLGSCTIHVLAAAWAASDRATENHVFSAVNSLRAARDERSRILLQELGRAAGETETAAVTDAYLELYAVVEAPIEGAVPVVEACRSRYRVGVVSNAYPDVQYSKLETLGLGQAFACVVLSEEFGIRKPDPAIFLEGCRRLSVDPARCLYVGDSYANDVVGAAAAGLPCCWLNADRSAPSGPERATIEIERLLQLPSLLGLLEA